MIEIIAYVFTIAGVIGTGLVALYKITSGVQVTLTSLDKSIQVLNEHLDEVKLDQREIKEEQKRTNEQVFKHTVELEKHNGRLNTIEDKLKKI